MQVYTKALTCAVNPDLKKEWKEYLDQTKHHVEIVRGVFEKRGLDPETDTPGRKVVRHIGASLVKAMELWIDSLGMPAVLPPPEEEKDVKTATGAARAKQARGKML